MNVDTLGIIGGTGWLGAGIAEAVLAEGLIEPGRLVLSNRSGSGPLSSRGVRIFTDNQQVVELSEVVVLSIRPEQFRDLSIDARGKCVISLMAGIPAAAVASATSGTVVRAMPNAAVQIRQSFTPWYSAGRLAERHRSFVQRLFECVGSAAEVPNEDCIDYLGALSGTGPAYPALLATALAHQAVAAGIPEGIARQAAQSVVVGSSQLLAQRSPQALLEALMAYRGVTAAALESLVGEGFEAMVGRALDAGAEVARRGM